MVSDIQLIQNIKKDGDGKSFTELLDRHSGIYTSIINRYSFHSAINKDNLIDDKVFNIYQYALDYDPNREMKFSSYIGQRIKYACQTIVTNHTPLTPLHLSEEIPDDENEGDTSWAIKIPCEKNDLDEYESDDAIGKVFKMLEEFKDQRVLKIFKLRHSPRLKKEMPWWKIGKELNISTQTAINIYNKNLRILKSKIHKEI